MNRLGDLRTWIVILVVASLAVPAAGDEIARGKELASRWCIACHVVTPNMPGGDAGPPFPAVAARPGQTEGALHAWLADPHPPMPNLALTATEFNALADYIMSLKPAE